MKSKLLGNKEFNITGRKFLWFIPPIVIILIAAVMLFVYGYTQGSPVNLGMDFAGGYAVNIQVGTNLTSDNFDLYREKIDNIASELSDVNGKNYGLKIDSYQKVGSEGSDSGIYVRYKKIINDNGDALSDTEMEEVGKKFTEALENAVLSIVPSVTQSGGGFTVRYTDSYGRERPMEVYRSIIEERLSGYSYTIDENNDKSMIGVTITSSGLTERDVTDLLTIEDEFSGKVIQANTVSGSISSDLILNAIIAVILALAIMLIYIGFRFEITSGISAIIALAHDMLMMFAFMFIFHIEFNSTFIAALITILGYSINNTIIIFDRVRENKSIMSNSSAAEIANKSVIETMVRSLNTTLTTIFMIGTIALVCGIVGIADMVTFSLPILVGLIAGLFSSIFIAPCMWTLFNKNKNFALSKKSKTLRTKKATQKN